MAAGVLERHASVAGSSAGTARAPAAKLAIGESPQVALGYLLLALVCWAVAGRTKEA